MASVDNSMRVPSGAGPPLRLEIPKAKPNSQPQVFVPFTGLTDAVTPFTWRPQKISDTIPLGSERLVVHKPLKKTKSTVNRNPIHHSDLLVQVGNASLDGPLPVLVNASSQDQNVEEVDDSWQKNEIPEELGYVRGEEPEEVRNIIQESLDEHRALRASRLHTQAIVVRTTITMSSSDSETGSICPSVETSATASIRSPDRQRGFDLHHSPDRPTSSDRVSSGSLALDSTISVGSSNGDVALNNLRTSTELYAATSSQESLSSSPRSSSAKLPKQSVRPSRNQVIFRFLGRRPKASKFTEDSSTAVVAPSECTSCFDEVPDKKAVSLPCQHKYCGACFSQLVSTAIHSEDTFPPRCCIEEIPRRFLDAYLSPKEMIEYDEKALEYAVTVGSRYYCGSTDCAKWIDTRKARRLNGALECPHCKFWMCTSCRGAQHRANQDCPQDFALGAALKQAELAGWRRCYSCRTMVELNTGCRHITCKCKAEFCYTCGARWRTCACTEADQARREAEIAERLARFNAEVQAEEAEVREAIAAVERAERRVAAEREAEERENEEARQAEELEELTRMEYTRVEGINNYFELLRATLERVVRQQKQAIMTRHESEIPKLEKEEADLTNVNVSKERTRQITLERACIVADNEEKIVELRRQHRTDLMHTIKRHRDDQDAVFLQPIRGPETHRGFITEGVLETLLEAQETERKTIQTQQEREIAKWRGRGLRALEEFDAIMREEQARFAKVHSARMEGIRDALTTARMGAEADWKWFDLLVQAREVMIDEDERRMVMSGSDAPDLLSRVNN